MISFYKWKKNAVLALTGILPTMVGFILFLMTIQYYTIEGYRLMYLDIFWLAISIAGSILTAVILIMVGKKLLRHAFTEMLEGKGLFTMILDSTGLIRSFNTQIAAPKMQGGYQDGIEDTYDMDLLHRLLIPENATLTQATTFKKDDKGNLQLGEIVDVLVLPNKEEKHNVQFAFENRPTLIFNAVMGKYLSRDAISKFEKDIEIKHNALNVLKKVINIDEHFRNFGRYIGETLKPKGKGIFASPLFKYIIIVAIVIMIVIIMLMFVPGLLTAGSRIGF